METRLQLIQLYYANQRSPALTLRAYKRANDLSKDPFSETSIRNLVKKFEETYSLHDKPRSGRPSLSEDRADSVLENTISLQAANPLGHCSSQHVANATGVPSRSVRRILKQTIGMHPYHITTHQMIYEADKDRRLDFAHWVLSNEDRLSQVLWTDEAYFTLDGCVNTHNCVIWAFENPHRTLSKSLHSPKLCVWFGFTSSFKLQPFFFRDTVNSENYLELLQSQVVPALRRKRVLSTTIFQQDGAPPHYATIVRDFLKSKFSEERIIARGVGQPWPPRSPDLTPLDYWFWGFIKARVYHCSQPSTLAELRQRIEEAIESVTPEELKRAVDNLLVRAELVLQERGGIFSHLM